MLSYKVKDTNHTVFYKADAQGKVCSSNYRFELYNVSKGEVVTSSAKSLTPRKSWSSLVSVVNASQAITELTFVDYDLGFTHPFTKALHERLQERYGKPGTLPPGDIKTKKAGWTWGLNNSTTKYLVDLKGNAYGQKNHSNYELTRMYELLTQWGICPNDKSLNTMEMRIVRDHILDRMIVVFVYGGAPSLEEPTAQLSRQEILVMHCKINQNTRHEGLPDYTKNALSSIIYKTVKQKQSMKCHVGRASNMFLTKGENRLNCVYLYDT